MLIFDLGFCMGIYKFRKIDLDVMIFIDFIVF